MTADLLGRRCRAGAAAALLLATVAGPLHAQRPFPYRLAAGRESALLATGFAILGAGVVVNAELDVLTPEDIAGLDPQDINGFDRPATTHWSRNASRLSDVLLVATVGGPMSLLAMARGPGEPVTVAVMLGETILLTNGVGQLTKTAFRRVRPFVYNDNPDISIERKTSKNARQSFPSGHATNAFASAVFLSTVYARIHPTSPARYWIWGGSLAAATTVGYLRYTAGKHFPTDVLAGAVLGSAIGWIVPKMHEGNRVRVALAAPGVDGPVIGLNVRF
jgi:membrane-associated phospholipid phosphatase